MLSVNYATKKKLTVMKYLHVFFLLLSFIVSTDLFGQNYNSLANGNWTTASNWNNSSGWGPNTPPLSGQGSGTIQVNHNLTISGNYSSGSITLNINSGDTLKITGNLTISGGSTINVYGTLIVEGTTTFNSTMNIHPEGKFIAKGNTTINSSPYLKIGTSVAPPPYAEAVFMSNLTLATSGDVEVKRNGRMMVYGNISATGGGTYFQVDNGGQVYIHGNFTFSSNGTITNNNTTNPYGLYVNGAVTNSGGTTTGNLGNLTQMQSSNPDLYNWGYNQESSPLVDYVPESSGYYWNGANVSSNPAAGGTGNWTTANAWRNPNSSGSQVTWSDNSGNNAYFKSTAGIVTTSSNRTFSSANFLVSGYSLTSNDINARTLTGNIIISDGKSLGINSLTSTTNRILNIAGSISGGTGASLIIYANQISGNYSQLGLASTNASISLPISIQAGSNTASYGNAAIVGTALSTQVSASSSITNNTLYRTAIGATTGNTININGVISGSADVAFAAGISGGDGIINLNAANNYTGKTYFNAANTGIVKLGLTNALPSTTEVIMASSTGFGGVFDLNGFNQTIASLSSGAGGGSITNNGASPSTLTVNGTQTPAAFGLVIANGTSSISVVKSGTGILTLSGANTFTGDFVLNDGTFRMGINSAAGSGILKLNGGIISSSNTTNRTLTNTTHWNGTITVGDITNNGILTLSGSQFIKNQSLIIDTKSPAIISGIISDEGNNYGIEKIGVSNLVVSAASTFTGNFLLTAGITRVNGASTGSANAVATGPLGRGLLVLKGGTITASGATPRTILNSVRIDNSTTFCESVTNTGALTFSGTVNLNSNSTVQTVESTVNFAGVVSDGGNAYNWSKAGVGTLTLTAANTFTGTVNVVAGTLRLNRTGGTTIPITNDIQVSGGIFRVSTNQTIKNLTITAGELIVDAGVTLTINGTYSSSGTITNNGTIILVGPTAFPGSASTISAMNNLTINRAGGVNLDKDLAIAGTLTLTSGDFNVLSNTLTLNGTYLAGTINNLKTNSNSNLILNCTGSGATTLPNFTAIGDLVVNSASRNYNLNSNLVISGDLNMAAGTLTIGAFNLTYSGGLISRTSGVLDASNASAILTFGNSTPLTLPSSMFTGNVNNITMNSSESVTLGSDVTIATSLVFTAGTLNVGANTLNFNGSTISRTSGKLNVSDASAYLTFNNASTVFLPNGLFEDEVNNLTLSNKRVNSQGDFTIKGILNLNNANPDATNGLLDMVQSYGSYANVHSTNSTDSYNNLNSTVLTLGPNATVTGAGDVTGKVTRTSFVDDQMYQFGNKNMQLTFDLNGGVSLPSKITVVMTKGDEGNHVDKDGVSDYTPNTADTLIGRAAVKRLFQVLRTDGSSQVRFTVRFPYDDSELNGNSEADLVTWDHHLPYAGRTPHEHGKTNVDPTENWVELSGHGIGYLATEGDAEFTKYWMLSENIIKVQTWLGAAGGAAAGDWNSASNWSKGTIPTVESILIPNATVTPNDPDPAKLPATINVATIEIQAGGVLNGGSSEITLSGGPALNGGRGSWLNNGDFIANSSKVIFDYTDATIAGTTTFNDIEVKAGKMVTIQASSNNSVSGTITNNGVFDATTYTNNFYYTGSNQNVIQPNGSTPGYSSLLINQSSGTATAATNIDVLNDFSILGNTFNLNNNTINIKGNFINNATFQSSGTVNMNGTSSQKIQGNSVTTFNNLNLNGASGNLVLDQDIKVNNVLTIDASKTLNGSTKEIEFLSSSTPFVNNGTFSADTSLVIYSGTLATNVSDETYHDLLISSTGAKSLLGNSTIKNQLTIDQSIFNVASYKLSLEGDGANSPIVSNSGKLNVSSGEIEFNNSQNRLTLPTDFFDGNVNDFTVKGSEDVAISDDIAVAGDLVLSESNLNLDSHTLTIETTGTLTRTNGYLNLETGLLKFRGATFNTDVVPSNNISRLEIDRPSGVVTMNGNLEVNDELLLTAGTFNISTFPIKFFANPTRVSGVIDADQGEVEFNIPAPVTLVTGLFETPIKTLKTNSNIQLTLSEPVVVSHDLQLVSGNIITSNSSLLEIGTDKVQTGAINWSNGNIVGPLKRWFAASTNGTVESGIFPVGTTDLNKYAQVNFTSAPEGGYLIVAYQNGLAPDSYDDLPLKYTDNNKTYYIQNADEEGYWEMTPYDENGVQYAALNTTPYNLYLRINNPTSVVNGGILNNPPRVRLIRAKGDGFGGHGAWELAGTHTIVQTINAGEDYKIGSGNVVGFSWFNGGGDNMNPLPVEFQNLNFSCKETPTLSWETASEFNSSHFAVQSSNDGVNWKAFEQIKAAGYSTELLKYELEIPRELISNYLRIEQFDNNGISKIYGPIYANCMSNESLIRSYPNPSETEFNVQFNANKSESVLLKIKDFTGKELFEKNYTVNAGVNLLNVKKELPAGVYIVEMEFSSGELHFFKQSMK